MNIIFTAVINIIIQMITSFTLYNKLYNLFLYYKIDLF